MLLASEPTIPYIPKSGILSEQYPSHYFQAQHAIMEIVGDTHTFFTIKVGLRVSGSSVLFVNNVVQPFQTSGK